jgi:hypothetical protein
MSELKRFEFVLNKTRISPGLWRIIHIEPGWLSFFCLFNVSTCQRVVRNQIQYTPKEEDEM